MARILDQFGNPIDTRRLLDEEAAPSLTGVRTIISDHPSRGLTPQRLSAILLEAEEGDPTRYLELAEDMEEKDLHYAAQLRTRRYAVAQLDISVVAASEEADDVRAADLVREVLVSDAMEQVCVEALDAIGKGYAVLEILWDRSGREWRPKDIVWRDPKWFQFDRADGTTLRLREGAELRPLTPYKYITHVHKAKSGLPIRGGIARAAAWAYLFKSFGVKDWVQFAEIFGQPYRVGKYHPSATQEDKAKLLRAVASIGTDAAAIIPEGMLIEFIEAARSGSIDLYERLVKYLDAQVSILVLGQTLTSNVSSDGGSRALGEVHDKVRRDIMRSDAIQLAGTLDRCLVRPLVDLNLGPRARYPQVRIGLPDELTTMQKVEALTKVVPLGVDVERSAVRDLLGFPEPAKDATVLAPAAAAPPPSVAEPDITPARRQAAAARAVHAAGAAASGDAIDDQVHGALADEGWREVMAPVVDPIEQLLGDAASLEELRRRLPDLVREIDPTAFTTALARLGFAARAAGEMEIPLGAGAGSDG